MFEVLITSKNFLLRNIEVHSLLNCYYVQVIHCSQRQGGWLDSSNSALSLQSQPVSQQRQRKATNQHLLQGQILYPLHGVRLQRMVQRQLLRQVRAIYFNMSSCLPYEVLLLLLLTEVFEDIVLRAFRFWRHSSRVRMSVDVYRAKSVSQLHCCGSEENAGNVH